MPSGFGYFKNVLPRYYIFVMIMPKWINCGLINRGNEVEKPQLGGAGCGYHFRSVIPSIRAALFAGSRYEPNLLKKDFACQLLQSCNY